MGPCPQHHLSEEVAGWGPAPNIIYQRRKQVGALPPTLSIRGGSRVGSCLQHHLSEEVAGLGPAPNIIYKRRKQGGALPPAPIYQNR